MKRAVGLALAIVLGLMPSVFAQISTGNIYGKVTDESGAVLPGATVALSGPQATLSTTSDSQGDFRFLNLGYGTYKTTVSLAGFTTVAREVIITTGANVSLTFGLKVATVEETVTVTAETPVVDTKKTGTAVTVSRAELEQTPQARDPWAVLRTVPGIVVDRVSIAGNEGGQQAGFQGKGSDMRDTTWNLDGVVIDDMSAAGAAPTYFDYDSFEELSVQTGGNGVATQTGGLGLNFVTKRGTNTWHGGGRYFITNSKLQSKNVPDELAGDSRLTAHDGPGDEADRIDQITDYGVDLGGPLLKDKLWFYGAWGKQDIRIARLTQTKDRTILKSINGKLNWQVSSSTQVSAYYFNGAKEKFGRDTGFLPLSEDGALWNQGNLYDDFIPGHPHGLVKFEVNHVFSPQFYLNAKYSNYDTGFFLHPRAGQDTTGSLDFVDDTLRGNGFFSIDNTRPLKNLSTLDGNYFAGNHEFKFGFGYKKALVTTNTIYGGNAGLIGYFYGPGDGGGQNSVLVARNGLSSIASDFWHGYASDTYTKGRLTVTAGVRYDHQKGGNGAGTIPAQGSFPNLLPEIVYQGLDDPVNGGTGIKWSNVSPRGGITYALDEARKTVLRGNFALYAGKLDTGAAVYDSPLSGSYLRYLWNDTNGDKLPQPGEVLLDLGYIGYGGVDPANPTALSAVNKIDPNYEAPKDLEAVVGIDHELAPNIGVGAAFTWRRSTDDRDWQVKNRSDAFGGGVMGQDDFVAGTPVTVTTPEGTFTGIPFNRAPGHSAPGRTKINRPDYHRGYTGLELTFNKRLANKWMLRGQFSFMNWKEYLEGPGAVSNPTRTAASGAGCGSSNGAAQSGPQVDGGHFVCQAGGSGKGDLFFDARWQFTVNGLYELGSGFEIAAAVFGRQGFAIPVYVRPTNSDAFNVLAVDPIDQLRLGNLFNVDLRLAKNVKFGRTNLTLSAEAFNVANSGTVLQRSRNAQSASFYKINEVIAPRNIRFGARFSF